MEGPDPDIPRPGRWRVIVLAALFALLAHGCFIAATSLSVDPF
jgi:hypothetical protein